METRRKILYIITKATWGGAQKYVFDLVTNLPKDAYEVTVAYGTKGRLADELEGAGIKTIRLPSLGRDVAFFADIKSLFAISHCIRAVRPDVVHLNSSKAAALGSVAARSCGVRHIIFTVHGVPYNEPRGILWKMLAYLGTWVTALFSHVVICVSDSDLSAIERMPFVARKAVRIYNGIDLSMSFGDGEIVRRNFPPGVKIVGTIGELNRNKNQVTLLERAAADPQLYVAIVGTGEDGEFLSREIQRRGLADRVKLLGEIRAAEALRGFDSFALPSLKEGLPYVLLEARAAGLPIEANRVGGVNEAIDRDLSEFSLSKMLERTFALYRA